MLDTRQWTKKQSIGVLFGVRNLRRVVGCCGEGRRGGGDVRRRGLAVGPELAPELARPTPAPLTQTFSYTSKHSFPDD